MAKTLDFNTILPPTLPLVMRDDRRTEVIVTLPTEGLVEELQTLGPHMTEMLQSNESEAIPVIYDLAARLISCNKAGLQVTAEELRDKYRLNLEALVVFYSVYLDFIGEINNAKN
jgi:hypothetical protein